LLSNSLKLFLQTDSCIDFIITEYILARKYFPEKNKKAIIKEKA